MSTMVIAPPLPDAPYRGVEPFRFTDQQIFAARGEETWKLLSNVTLYRAVMLFGASGTGKSSLINAGFLPLSLKENYVPDRLRVQPFAGREIKVERMRMSGHEEKAAYLPSNFVPAEANTSAESIELSLADFRRRLEEFRPAATEPESGFLFQEPRASQRPLLIFDQFEEFVTLFEEAHRVSTIEDTPGRPKETLSTQQKILKTLVELIQDETLPIKIIFAFREDYLAKLSLLIEHCPDLLDQAQRLLPPSLEALPQIIRAPFTNPELRAHFLKHGDTSGSEISEPLAEKIAAELGRRSEGAANLTELQIVCQRLWLAPDAENLFTKDGIEGLLKSYGTDVFRHFTTELRDAAIVLLSHMITASNTRNIISEEDLLSRTAQCDFQPAQCSDALSALSRGQIVRREPRHSIYFYEITSEYLVPWIKEQVAERKSAEEQRLAEAARQKLEEERAQAVAKFEAEQRRGRLLRRLLTAMILLLIVTIWLGVFAYRQYKRAAEAERSSKRILTALNLLTSKQSEESLEGIAQIDRLIKENKLSSDLKSLLITPASTNPDERVREAANQVLTQAAQTDQNLTQSIDTVALQLPPRFFIHIADESQRTQAQQLAALLRKQGYLVPGIQNVGEKGVRNNQLRYFRDSEPGIPTPQEIIALLNKANAGRWIVNRVRGYEQSTKVTAGQFELWLASPAAAQPAENPVTERGALVLHLIDQHGDTLPGANPQVKIAPFDDQFYSTRVLTGTRFPLDEGEYAVTVDLKGYEPDDNRVSIKAGQTTTLRLKLKPKVERR